jgi:hypothetical protein
MRTAFEKTAIVGIIVARDVFRKFDRIRDNNIRRSRTAFFVMNSEVNATPSYSRVLSLGSKTKYV